MKKSNLQIVNQIDKTDYSDVSNENYSKKSDKEKLQYLELQLLQYIESDLQALRFIAFHIAYDSFTDSEFNKDNLLYSVHSLSKNLFDRVKHITGQF